LKIITTISTAAALLASAAAFAAKPGPLINQTEGGAITKVAEGCGIGYFRDGHGNCRYFGYGAPAAPPGEACPPDRHFVPWTNHSGGRCLLND
jgi:hypothetical protein